VFLDDLIPGKIGGIAASASLRRTIFDDEPPKDTFRRLSITGMFIS
jgi:hypothetical protein